MDLAWCSGNKFCLVYFFFDSSFVQFNVYNMNFAHFGFPNKPISRRVNEVKRKLAGIEEEGKRTKSIRQAKRKKNGNKHWGMRM